MINRKKFDFVLAAYLVLLILFGCLAIFSASTTHIGNMFPRKPLVEAAHFAVVSGHDVFADALAHADI